MPGASLAGLEAAGVVAVLGTVINPAGLTHAKAVPIARARAFANPGLGASPVFHAFAIDQTGIVFSDDIGVVGDERIRIDLSALHGIGDGLAWAPGEFVGQDGEAIPACARGTLTRVAARLAGAGAMDSQAMFFQLAPSLRYAHTEPHVRTRLSENGFDLLKLRRTTIRMDAGKPVSGILFLASRRP